MATGERARILAVVVPLLFLAWEEVARAADPALSTKTVRVVVLDVRAPDSRWGDKDMTRAIVRQMKSEIGETLVESDLAKAAKTLGIAPDALLTPENLAQAGKSVGAHYVLLTRISKQGWLYTARAVLVSCTDGAISMDFRSDYYKPSAEAADRGSRIARKTTEKIGLLLAAKSPPKADDLTPPVPPAKPPVPDDAVASETPPVTPPPATSTAAPSTESSAESGSDLMDAFAAEFGEGTASTVELDAVTDEGGWNWQIRGWFGTKTVGFLDPELPERFKRAFVKLGFKTTLTGKLGPKARLRVLPLVEVDLRNQRLHRVIVEEGFLEYSFGSTELRLGWDSPSWGSASTVHVVDVINARDLTEGLMDAPKLGQPMAQLRFLFDDHAFTLMYLSPFVRPQFPRLDLPFTPYSTSPQADTSGTGVGEKVLYGSTLDEWHPQAAARLALALGRTDLRASYFYGYSRFPFIHLPTDTTFYPLMQHASTDVQVLLEGWSLKAELALVKYFETDRSRRPPLTLNNRQPAASIPIPSPTLTWVVGLEKTFDVFDSTSFTPLVELIADSDSRWFKDDQPPDVITRSFENHLVYGFRWDFNNDVDGRVTFSDIMDLRNPSDHYLTLMYEERWFQHFTFALGGRLGLARDGATGAAASFEQLTGVEAELRLNY